MIGTRERGTVKWFADQKGFGFIRREDGTELFVHYRQIRGTGHRSLEADQEVEFSIGDDNRGRPMAMDVALNFKR